MTDFASLQPTNRDAFEVSAEEVGAARIDAIPNPIRDIDDPDKVPASALPFIAWARGTGVWDDAWPEWLKRKAVRNSIHLRQRTGTLAAYRGWLDLWGAEIVEVIAPPGGCFATEGQTEAEKRAYLERFAQLRITFRRSPGPGDEGSIYAATAHPGEPLGFVNHAFAVPGTSQQRYGRRATIIDGGNETRVIWSTAGAVLTDGVPITVERITVPGVARASEPFVNDIFAGAERSFAEAFETTSRILTLGLDRSPQAGLRMPLISRDATPLVLISTTPDRVAERAEWADRPVMVGGLTGDFVQQNTAEERYYDRFYLFDEARSSVEPTAGYGTFVGHSWTEITPFTAQIRVRYPGETAQAAAYVGHFVGMFPEPPSDRIDRIAAAVRAGKSARDKTFFTAHTRRIRTLEDGIPLDGAYSLGGLIDIARGSSQ